MEDCQGQCNSTRIDQRVKVVTVRDDLMAARQDVIMTMATTKVVPGSDKRMIAGHFAELFPWYGKNVQLGVVSPKRTMIKMTIH